jgi:hypothetical protein
VENWVIFVVHVVLKQGVCQTVALPFTLKGKRRIMKTQIFQHAKI